MDGIMVPILGIIAPFLTALLIILIIFVSKVLRDRSKNEVITKALENGVELSPDIFKNAPAKKTEDPLTSALVTIGVGIGLFIALYLFFDQQLKFAAFGFIPLFIGLGQLIGYFVNKRHKGDNLSGTNE